MRVESAELSAFLVANEQTTVCQLIPLIRQAGQSGLDLLSPNTKVQKVVFDKQTDVDSLKTWYLVWYKANSKGEAGWNYAGCANYTVGECADSIGNLPQEKAIKDCAAKLEDGQIRDVTLVVAHDTKLDKRVIVDGCKRSVAIALIAQRNTSRFGELINSSSLRITAIELKSELTHCLYPCDFLNLFASGISK